VIFVVDDDPRILSATASALRDAGYSVTMFASGGAALDAMAAQLPHLLITDVLMPEMNGTHLAESARTISPDLPILFISGDVGDTPAEAFAGHPLLAKPFTAQQLCKAAAKLLKA
jgi:CheY-like chemotaxis protein